MLFNDKNLCLVGTKDIWFVTTEGNLYFGNRDFNKTAARRFISNNGEEFTSDKIYAWGYQSEVLSKDNTNNPIKSNERKMDDEEKEYVVKTNLKSYRYKYKKCGNCGKEYRKKDAYNYAYCPICGAKFINIKK